MTHLLLALALTSTPLSDMGLSHWQQGFGRPQANRAVLRGPLVVNGVRHERGIGAHAPAHARYRLGGRATSIQGTVGVNDTGSGWVAFSVWVDGEKRWASPVIKRGQPPVPFRVELEGARELLLLTSDARNGDGGDHANWLDVQVTHTGTPPTPLPAMRTLKVQLDRTHQTIDNFAASDSWTVEPLIRWPEWQREQIATLLFDREKGIGLSGWRHNLGGGINHETITMPLRTADTYDAGEGGFDFSRNPGQRWMLQAAKRHGVEQIVFYAITPPRRLTRNGFTNGTDGQGSTNLNDGGEDAFARYLAGIVEHFRGEGYPVSHLSPINEPDYEWNGVPEPSSQEGSRASNADLLRQTRAIADELRRRGLPVQVLTPEASSPNIGFTLNEGMSKKYGSPYGAYAALFAEETEWRAAVDPVYGYHSYWADGLGTMVPSRERLRQELDRTPGLNAWMTEYCQLSGPRNEGGWGRDLGMTMALNLARLVQLDLTLVHASAWQWWLAVSDADYKDGLIYVDDLDQEVGVVYPSKSLWALGNFSRFVRPGFVRVETEGPFEDVSGVIPSAFRDPRTGRVVVVLVNTEPRPSSVEVALEGHWKGSSHLTSDRPGHDLAPGPEPKLGQPYVVPSRSVVTLVYDPI